MVDAEMNRAVSESGAAMGEAIGLFMLHPETFAESAAAGYGNPMAAYVAGRGGVLGEATGTTVSAVFTVFEPTVVGALWDEGIAVRGAAGASELYWDQIAGFGRRYLTGAEGLARIAELGGKIIESTPGLGLPLYAGWRTMPRADDAAARALHVLRELRGDVHFSAFTLSGVTPVEAHMLHGGPEYTSMFGWTAPYATGADKKDSCAAVEEATNNAMAQIFSAALDRDEATELARLSVGALAVLKAAVPG